MPSVRLVNDQRIDCTKVTLAGPVAALREHTKPIDGMPAAGQLAAWLRLDGGASASKALNVDGSGTPALFWYTTPASVLATVRRVSIVLADAAILEEGFGGLAALATGLALEVTDDAGGALLDLTGGEGVKSHADLLAFGADLRFIGTTLVAAAWDLATPIELAPAQRLRATVRDDLTGLTRATIFVAGETRTNA